MPAAAKYMGPIGNQIKFSQDEDGHRTITVPFKVRGVPGVHGPNAARKCVNLHVPTGSQWGALFSGADEGDDCAWCRPTMECVPDPKTQEGVSPEQWIVTRTFSTRPQRDGGERCWGSDAELCDPLSEPQKISVDYSQYTEEAAYDRFGRRVLTSSLEPIHGPNNEWEFTHTSVVIEQNVLDDQLALVEQIKDSVNALPLWGLPPRTIKFKPGGSQRKCRVAPSATGTGVECVVYWTRKLIFEIRFRRREGAGTQGTTGTLIELTPVPGGPYETWDRDVWDEGTRVLRGYWSDSSGVTGTGTHKKTHWRLVDIDGAPPDPRNPQHFIRFKDWNGENTRTLLDGAGKPAFVPEVVNQWWIILELYHEDFGSDRSLRIVRLPCAAALKAVGDRDLLGEISDVTLHGPFTTEADAASAVLSHQLGDYAPIGPPVLTCPDTTPSVGVVHIEKYGQSDFLLLGIPKDFRLMLPPFHEP
jgi:hypothetical protein